MGSTITLRSRRSAAQLHALVQLEREIRATDPHLRRKYLRDFSTAYQRYESVLSPEQTATAFANADILLVGDYHSLPASQQFAGELLIQLARRRPVVLGVEAVFARNQNALDDWLQGVIDGQELRERTRFDLDWSYDWAPFYSLMQTARDHASGIYGLDCMPRNDLRRIAARDRHAATKIAEIRVRHPEAALVVLFGESHLAPNHLPGLVRANRPDDRLLTVLQNIDALYWMAAGEPHEHVQTVRVSSDVICVFNSTPLDKYESYRLCIERWRSEHPIRPDLAPSFYNMVDALSRFLNIDRYSASNHTQPRFLVDQLPEIYYRPSDERIRRLLQKAPENDFRTVRSRLEEHGCTYVPQARALLIREFHMVRGAEEAARFLHHACAGVPGTGSPEDRFYVHVLQDALGYFGSRALYPGRAPVRVNPQKTLVQVSRLADGPAAQNSRALGYSLGSDLYDAYLSGHATKRYLRSLFFRALDRPGAARSLYFSVLRRLRIGFQAASRES